MNVQLNDSANTHTQKQNTKQQKIHSRMLISIPENVTQHLMKK